MNPKQPDFPDVTRAADLIEAARAVADRRIDEALSGGEYVGPEPFDDLGYLHDRCRHLYLHYRWWTPAQRQTLARFAGDAAKLIQLATSGTTSAIKGDDGPPDSGD